MKKSKRSFELEDQESGPSGKIGIELDKHDDEEIIDLDDIVELGGQPEEEDELDLGVELIDLDSDMDFKDIGREGGPEDDALEEDLLRGLPMGKPVSTKKSPPDVTFPDEEDEPSDLLEGFSMDAVQPQDAKGAPKGDLPDVSGLDDPLEGLIFAEEKKPKADPLVEIAMLREERTLPPEAAAGVKSPLVSALDDVLEETQDLPPVSRPVVEKEVFSSEGRSSLDAVADEIEARLTDMVRGMVEAKLPEIVREVLREEIRKLKAELK